jgi:hypothetical protein
MKKIFFLISFYIIFFTSKTYAVVGNEVEKSKENVSFISQFLSTELLLNIIFATVVIIITLALAKAV